MSESKTFRRTRIAPTPSGYLHLGNAYSFALTAKLAQEHQAEVLLRVDDLDRDRIQLPYVQDVFDTLNFLGIGWEDGPFDTPAYQQQWSQVYRMAIYQNMLRQLRDMGAIFACDCSRAKVLQDSPTGEYPGTCLHKHIPVDAPGVQWRLDTSLLHQLRVNTLQEGLIDTTLPPIMQYFVVRKKDGFPAYQLASVADDVHFGIDLVIRGADLWDSTLAQLYLAQVLGLTAFQSATFHHHPLMTEADGRKLSKSDGSTSIQYLRRQGHTAADIYRMLGL